MSESDQTDRLASQRLRVMRDALASRQIGVEYRTTDGEVVTEGLPPDWAEQWLDEAQAAHLAYLRQAVAQGSREASMRIEAATDGETHVLQITAVGAGGDRDGTTTIVADVSEEAAHERVLAGLLREVSHRSKNLLAIVLSIAAQTARHAQGTEAFLEKFRGRILALSSAQDLITASDWVGTPFSVLVGEQLRRSGLLPGDAIALSGVDPVLGPNAALHVGLALHELIVNAATHGDWQAADAGQIRLEVRAENAAPERDGLIIEWLEQRCDGEQAASPEFGTILLKSIVPRSLSGAAHYTMDDRQITYRLRVPAAQLRN